MEMFEVFYKRRSIRKFQPKSVEKEKIKKILKAAFLSPSSYNRRAWIFIIVDDHKILKLLSQSKKGASPLANAPVATVVIIDSEKDDIWIEDGAIAAEHMQLAAVALGLASFWVQIRRRSHNDNMTAEEYVRNILNIPKNYRVVCIIGFGYPAEQKEPHGNEVLEWKKVRYNSFSKKYEVRE